MGAKEFGLVIPFFNEEKRIDCDRLIDLFTKWPGKVLMVDDGSTDKTHELLSRIEQRCDAKVLRINKNHGKASAIRIGLINLSAEKDLDWLCVFDSDFSVDEKDVFKAINLASQVRNVSETSSDRYVYILSGSRLLSSGRENVSLNRHPTRDTIGKVIRALVRTLCKIDTRDPQTPLKVYLNNSSLREIVELSSRTRWFFDVEVVIRARNLGLKIRWTEFNLENWRDIPTENYSGFRSFFVLSDLILIFLIRFMPKRFK